MLTVRCSGADLNCLKSGGQNIALLSYSSAEKEALWLLNNDCYCFLMSGVLETIDAI